MTVLLKQTKDYGYGILSLFGVSQDLITAAKVAKVEITTTSPGCLIFKRAGKEYEKVFLKGQAITLQKGAMLGAITVQGIRNQLVGALTKALDGVESEKPAVGFSQFSEDAETGDSIPDTTLSFDKEEEEEEDQIKLFSPNAKKKPVATFTITKATGFVPGQPVKKLATTEDLYYPVSGSTDGGKPYYTVAFFSTVALAARIKGSKLSIRAEARYPATAIPFDVRQSLIKKLGFDSAANHISAHYVAEGKDLIIKTLGAVLAAIGVHDIAAVVNLETFVDGHP